MAEIRKDLFQNGWVVSSSHRNGRPNDYIKKVKCPFCPQNEHLTPPNILEIKKNNKWDIRVVPNRYPAFVQDEPADKEYSGFYEYVPADGFHEVVIETPKHNEKFENLSVSHMEKILNVYAQRYKELKKRKKVKYVMVFKNVGAQAGASLRHPHSQVVALPLIPLTVENEIKSALKFNKTHKACLFCRMLKEEKKTGERIVFSSNGYSVFAPFSSRFFFETWIMPEKHEALFENSKNFFGLAAVLKKTLTLLSKSIENVSYNLIIHSYPGNENSFYHWHIEILPKLASMAGFEWGSGFYINSMKPEAAAAILREGRRFSL